jgi:hypothetical protein
VKILATNVIRAARSDGSYRGSLIEVDLETKECNDVLDWDDPSLEIDRSKPQYGDHGIHGVCVTDDHIWISGHRFLFKLSKDYKVLGSYTHDKLAGTHNICWDKDSNVLWVIANANNSILVFDLMLEQFCLALEHGKGFVKPDDIDSKDSLHIDSVSVNGDFVWYSGSGTDTMFGVNKQNGASLKYKPHFAKTHDIKWHSRYGLIYNLSLESKTVMEFKDKVVVWDTPHLPYENVDSVSRPRYTRGMVTMDGAIVVGTSPASVITNYMDGTQEVIQISKDIRHSICCMDVLCRSE